MATHSSILAWRIPWTEEPGGLQSMGLPRIRHNWATNTLRELLVMISLPSPKIIFSVIKGDPWNVNTLPRAKVGALSRWPPHQLPLACTGRLAFSLKQEAPILTNWEFSNQSSEIRCETPEATFFQGRNQQELGHWHPLDNKLMVKDSRLFTRRQTQPPFIPLPLPLSSLSQRHLPGQGPWGLPSQRRAFLDEKQAGKRVDVEHAGLHAPPVRILWFLGVYDLRS